ncbi:MAG: hypothetical protein ACI9FG_001636, partial [Crocinitomicaceae bacterium]
MMESHSSNVIFYRVFEYLSSSYDFWSYSKARVFLRVLKIDQRRIFLIVTDSVRR